MSERTIELVYFDGCPNAERARENLRAAAGPGSWREWNLSSEETPDRYRRYGSPTVLVEGWDVTGEDEEHVGVACRADGAPSTEVILAALTPDR